MLNLHDKLGAFYAERSRYFQKRFNRAVPFGDTVVDRWEKARMLGFGKNTSIYDSALVLGDVRVGSNVWIGPHVVLDGTGGGLCIGSYCSISAGVQIYTHNSVGWAVTGGQQAYMAKPVTIGSCVYIGPNVTIAAGVSIGDHVIIGAHSFVNKNVKSQTFVAGVPAIPQKKIIFISEKEYQLEDIRKEKSK
ncbi:acyltransferase [Desulfovibrio piger]|uniref:acyltransferase n=1 Tax=Desulfovibrio piger TaxID=901 RepID=UPI00195D85F0|nr:acyltransferase [Desulfovibrio piger]MBM6893880.1 acyltransferase [Desulfovibrio piger]